MQLRCGSLAALSNICLFNLHDNGARERIAGPNIRVRQKKNSLSEDDTTSVDIYRGPRIIKKV